MKRPQHDKHNHPKKSEKKASKKSEAVPETTEDKNDSD